jgi:hypothetical protein
MLTYEQDVALFRNADRLPGGDRSKLMGETLKKVYGWQQVLDRGSWFRVGCSLPPTFCDPFTLRGP